MQATADISNLIGKPFQNGGRGPDSYDCWGLAREVFRRYGVDLPDYTISCEDASRIDAEIAAQRTLWIECDSSNPPTPALVVMKFSQAVFVNHTGVYIGNGRFIHIAEKARVHISRMDHPMWRKAIQGFYVPRWAI